MESIRLTVDERHIVKYLLQCRAIKTVGLITQQPSQRSKLLMLLFRSSWFHKYSPDMVIIRKSKQVSLCKNHKIACTSGKSP